MILSKSSRTRILAVAGWFDRIAQRLRRIARETTPKRNKTEAQSVTGD
jgi:hypothetical protein